MTIAIPVCETHDEMTSAKRTYYVLIHELPSLVREKGFRI